VGIKDNLLSDFDAEATEIGELNPSDSLLMPQRVNLHEESGDGSTRRH